MTNRHIIASPLRACGALAALSLVTLVACSASDAPADAGPSGGPIDAAVDLHCATADDGGRRLVTVDPAACMPDAGMGGDAGEAEPEEEHVTMYGQTGDDDDCKYHLSFSTSPVRKNEDVTLTLTVTSLADGTAVTGAEPMAEIFLSDTHPAPNAATKTTETTAGTYTIAPVRFDAAGDWTVRFHLFDTCADSEESPHGHGAFYVRVP